MYPYPFFGVDANFVIQRCEQVCVCRPSTRDLEGSGTLPESLELPDLMLRRMHAIVKCESSSEIRRDGPKISP